MIDSPSPSSVYLIDFLAFPCINCFPKPWELRSRPPNNIWLACFSTSWVWPSSFYTYNFPRCNKISDFCFFPSVSLALTLSHAHKRITFPDVLPINRYIGRDSRHQSPLKTLAYQSCTLIWQWFFYQCLYSHILCLWQADLEWYL